MALDSGSEAPAWQLPPGHLLPDPVEKPWDPRLSCIPVLFLWPYQASFSTSGLPWGTLQPPPLPFISSLAVGANLPSPTRGHTDVPPSLRDQRCRPPASLFTSPRLSVPRCSAGLTPPLLGVDTRVTLSGLAPAFPHFQGAGRGPGSLALALPDETDRSGGGSHSPAGRGLRVASQKGAGVQSKGEPWTG